MDSLYSVFSKGIQVIYQEDHVPTFNGWPTVDAALMNSNELYKELSFVDRMAISAHVMNELCPISEEVPTPQPSMGAFAPGHSSFIYTYDWDHTTDDYTCMVFNAATGDIVFDEWFKVLKQHNVMETVEDVDGLMQFLIHHGELLSGDKVTFKFKDEDGDDPLET